MIDCSKCLKQGDCCGLFPMNKELVNRNKHKFQVNPIKIIEDRDRMGILTEDLFSVFLNRETKTCTIYEERPEVCKLYGVSKDKRLQCPYFKSSGAKRSEASMKKVSRYCDCMTKQIMKFAEDSA
jgi:Fe-S-cluster containining protein